MAERSHPQALLSRFAKEYGRAQKRPVAEIDVPTNGKLVVVGDLHGQLQDALYILHKQGPPSADTAFVFNGDIADRGPQAVEIFALVFLYYLLHPDRVRLAVNEGQW